MGVSEPTSFAHPINIQAVANNIGHARFGHALQYSAVAAYRPTRICLPNGRDTVLILSVALGEARVSRDGVTAA